MIKKIVAVLVIIAMISVSIPVISAIPDEPTLEEEKEIIKKYIERQSGSKGWVWLSIANRNSQSPSGTHDIVPELMRRAQYNLQNLFKVDYAIESSTSNSFQASWKDELYTDNDSEDFYEGYMLWAETITGGDDNRFDTGQFSVEYKGYWDMDIYIDVNDNIGTTYDEYQNNNMDEEYKYFTWL